MKTPSVFLCDLTYTQQTVSSDVVPAAVGSIAAFLEREMPCPIEIDIFKYPEKLVEKLDALRPEDAPQVVGFSNYVWNCHLSVEFSKVIKLHFPETVIVFGGPNLPYDLDEQERFLRRHPVIDFHTVREGEIAFLEIVKTLYENDYDPNCISEAEIANLVFIDSQDKFRASEQIERVPMEILPSPYLNGMLDEFFDGKLLPIVQTNRGCPFACTFCTEGMRYWTKVRRGARERVVDELKYIAQKVHALGEDARSDLHIADSNFGMYPEDVETAHVLAQMQKEYNYPKYINVSTGKNKKERILEVATIVDGAMKLAGSVQSLDQEVLQLIKRDNISGDALMTLATDASLIGANSYSEVILALPGDTLKAHFETLRILVEAGFNTIAMYQLMILPGTEMGSDVSRNEFEMVTKFRLLPRCYGHFDVLGHEINVGEIEEVCIANSTLSYTDYLNGRKMNFIVNVFYNDGVFRDLLTFFNAMDLSIWEWITIIYNEKGVSGDFKQLLDKFLGETESELWDDYDALKVFSKERENIIKVINGEIGGNLMFNYKGQSMTVYLEDVARVAEEAAHTLLMRHQKDTPEALAFVSEIVRFNYLKMKDLFADELENLNGEFVYDIGRFSEESENLDIATYRFDEPVRVSFEFDQEQVKSLRNYLSLFGNSQTGISRILSRVYIRKLFRNARLDSGKVWSDEKKSFLTGQASLSGLNEFE